MKRHWSKATEAGSQLGMKALMLANQVLGRSGFRFFLYPVMTYYYWKRKEERLASKDYLEKVSPFLDKSKREQLSSFQHFMTFGELLLDKLLVWKGLINREDVEFESRDLLDKIDNGEDTRGGILIVSHLGNTEVCNALAHKLPNIRLTLLVYTQHAEKYNSLVKKGNENARVDILQVNDMSPATAMILSERIEAGEYIVIGGDRTPLTTTGRVSDVDFLGHKAPMPQGAFLIASLLKCPVYLMFCLKHQKTYRIYVELFSEQLKFPRKAREENIKNIVQAYADRLQSYCLKEPLQWFNFYSFWHDEKK